MNWCDEHYVKLYTRDSLTWRAWPWQSKALWVLILRKLDGAGVLEVGQNPIDGVALQVECPRDFVAVGLRAIIESGTLSHAPGALICDAFLEAQEARKTPQQAKKDQRITAKAQRRIAQISEITMLGCLPPAQPSPAQPSSLKDKRLVDESVVESLNVTTIDSTCEEQAQFSLIAPPNRINAPPETLEDRLQEMANGFTDDEYEVFQFWRDVMKSPASRPSPARKKLIAKQLKLYTVEQLKDAIEGCAASKWHMGENPGAVKYNSLKLILRDEDKIEFFIQLGRKGTTNAANTRR
jgi:hypothetical protein